jgi:hypothetical protein
MSIMKSQMDRLFLLCSNGWSLELLLPWMDQEQVNLNLKWIEMRKEDEVAREIVDYFLENRSKVNSYYAYLHFFETHYPFCAPNLPRDGTHRKEALLYVDEQIGRILDACNNEANIVLCSDHNLPPKIVSAAFDTPAPQTMLSFIATNFKEIPKTFPGDHLAWAKAFWQHTTGVS